jgi:3-isopropylmalate dehydratase
VCVFRNDFGIRCIIAPSFAEIFKTNAMQNGMLPVVLSQENCKALAADGEEGLELEVDLERLEIRRPNGRGVIKFEVEPFKRHCLVNGLDDIGLTLQKVKKIEEFETKRTAHWPWLDGFGYAKKGGKIAATRSVRRGKTWGLEW